jgi:hypothetical protein
LPRLPQATAEGNQVWLAVRRLSGCPTTPFGPYQFILGRPGAKNQFRYPTGNGNLPIDQRCSFIRIVKVHHHEAIYFSK